MAKLTKQVAAPLTQASSANYNALQDEAINRPVRVPAGAGYQSAGGVGAVFDGAGTYTINANTQTLSVPLPVKPGVRIIEVRARITDQAGFGGGTCLLDVIKATDGVAVSLGTSAASSGAGTPQTLAVVGLTEDVTEVGVSMGEVYMAEIRFAGAVPQSVHSIEVDTDLTP